MNFEDIEFLKEILTNEWAAILVLCFILGFALKHLTPLNNSAIPVILSVFGGILGIIFFGYDTLEHASMSFAVGAATGFFGVGLHSGFKETWKFVFGDKKENGSQPPASPI